jgi:hypothetical protein
MQPPNPEELDPGRSGLTTRRGVLIGALAAFAAGCGGKLGTPIDGVIENGGVGNNEPSAEVVSANNDSQQEVFTEDELDFAQVEENDADLDPQYRGQFPESLREDAPLIHDGMPLKTINEKLSAWFTAIATSVEISPDGEAVDDITISERFFGAMTVNAVVDPDSIRNSDHTQQVSGAFEDFRSNLARTYRASVYEAGRLPENKSQKGWEGFMARMTSDAGVEGETNPAGWKIVVEPNLDTLNGEAIDSAIRDRINNAPTARESFDIYDQATSGAKMNFHVFIEEEDPLSKDQRWIVFTSSNAPDDRRAFTFTLNGGNRDRISKPVEEGSALRFGEVGFVEPS